MIDVRTVPSGCACMYTFWESWTGIYGWYTTIAHPGRIYIVVLIRNLDTFTTVFTIPVCTWNVMLLGILGQGRYLLDKWGNLDMLYYASLGLTNTHPLYFKLLD